MWFLARRWRASERQRAHNHKTQTKVRATALSNLASTVGTGFSLLKNRHYRLDARSEDIVRSG